MKAIARFVRIAPRKARLVADLVRGKSVDEALNILRFTHKAAAKPIEKVLRSAVANASVRGDVDVDNLMVKKAIIGDGPTMKRFRPGPQGRAMEVRKRTCHISIFLGEE